MVTCLAQVAVFSAMLFSSVYAIRSAVRGKSMKNEVQEGPTFKKCVSCLAYVTAYASSGKTGAPVPEKDTDRVKIKTEINDILDFGSYEVLDDWFNVLKDQGLPVGKTLPPFNFKLEGDGLDDAESSKELPALRSPREICTVLDYCDSWYDSVEDNKNITKAVTKAMLQWHTSGTDLTDYTEAAENWRGAPIQINVPISVVFEYAKSTPPSEYYKNGYQIGSVQHMPGFSFRWPFVDGSEPQYQRTPDGRYAKENYACHIALLDTNKTCDWPSYAKKTCRGDNYDASAQGRPYYACKNIFNRASGCRAPFDEIFGTVAFELDDSFKQDAVYWLFDSLAAGDICRECDPSKNIAFNNLWPTLTIDDVESVKRALYLVGQLKEPGTKTWDGRSIGLPSAATTNATILTDNGQEVLTEAVILRRFKLKHHGSTGTKQTLRYPFYTWLQHTDLGHGHFDASSAEIKRITHPCVPDDKYDACAKSAMITPSVRCFYVDNASGECVLLGDNCDTFQQSSVPGMNSGVLNHEIFRLASVNLDHTQQEAYLFEKYRSKQNTDNTHKIDNPTQEQWWTAMQDSENVKAYEAWRSAYKAISRYVDRFLQSYTDKQHVEAMQKLKSFF